MIGVKTRCNKYNVAVMLLSNLLISTCVYAESNSTSGSGNLSAPANLDFKVVIEHFLYFQVGSPGTTVDEMTFTVTSDNIGNGVPVNGTGGNAQSGSATQVVLKSNAGQITIREDNNSMGQGMQNENGQAIPYSSLSSSSNNNALQPPTLSDSGGNTSLPTLGNNGITNRTSEWSYSFANNSPLDSGTYGTQARGGRVMYTASSP